jgi:DNA-binding CsgD family transcriptional regulator
MQLIEREVFLASLQNRLEMVEEGDGHCVLISGEAGIGKTSLVKEFCKDKKKNCRVYIGTCDSLFTPRPLGPVYDILWQMKESVENMVNNNDRDALFTGFLHELERQRKTSIIIFEDTHWADEATIDFIKFLSRRITQLHCLCILSYRDNEIHSSHSLKNLFGQLPAHSFTRMQLVPLSRQAVEKMANEKGWNGQDVYTISNGNPFYVNEILASYSRGIPENIKDSILSVYNSLDEDTKQILRIMSVLPTGFEIKHLKTIEPFYLNALQNCLELGILVDGNDQIYFKHELYRRTIENSLSPFTRLALNKRVLDLFLESFEQHDELERIVHHAKNANENELVVKYAPLAAKKAALVGAHTEAAKLYLSAIANYRGKDMDVLLLYFENYAYECYLTNQIKEAIIYQEKGLRIWKEKNNPKKIGDALSFLSRLWWCDGDLKKAEQFGIEAIKTFDEAPPSKEKARALNNMSHLKIISDQPDECLLWGERARLMAENLGDEKNLSLSLANIGCALVTNPATREEGIELLQKTLVAALQHNDEDNASRIYGYLAENALRNKDYRFAEKVLGEGLQYCEKRYLGLANYYLLSLKAWLRLEMGFLTEALEISEELLANEGNLPIVRLVTVGVAAKTRIMLGDESFIPILFEVMSKALETGEAQRIIPLMSILLEYEWIYGKKVIGQAELDLSIKLIGKKSGIYEISEFAFWLFKSRKLTVFPQEIFEGYDLSSHVKATKAASVWKRLGCPFEQAIALFEGSDSDKRMAVEIVHNMGAVAVYKRMIFEMRVSGVSKIPRGKKRSTLANPANLTNRELDVLALLKEGLLNKEIGLKLFISPKTVDNHISSIFLKLDVNSRVKAVSKANELELIK